MSLFSSITVVGPTMRTLKINFSSANSKNNKQTYVLSK